MRLVTAFAGERPRFGAAGAGVLGRKTQRAQFPAAILCWNGLRPAAGRLTIFTFPLRALAPGDFPRRGRLLFTGKVFCRQGSLTGRAFYRSGAAAVLFAAHHRSVAGPLFEEATLEHPVDLFLEFVGLVGLDPD